MASGFLPLWMKISKQEFLKCRSHGSNPDPLYQTIWWTGSQALFLISTDMLQRSNATCPKGWKLMDLTKNVINGQHT